MLGPENIAPQGEPQRHSLLSAAGVELDLGSDLGSFHSCEMWIGTDGQKYDVWDAELMEEEALEDLVRGAVNDNELLS